LRLKDNTQTKVPAYQKRLDDFADEYDVKFSWLHWRHPDGELRHKLRALGSGVSVLGDWCETKEEAVDNIFKKIESDD
jgi:hypothetical protein